MRREVVKIKRDKIMELVERKEWSCLKCEKENKEGIACKVPVISQDELEKVSLCLDCAEEVFSLSAEKISTLKEMGVEGYKLMDDI